VSVSLLAIERSLADILAETYPHVVRGEMEGNPPGAESILNAPGNQWLRARIAADEAAGKPVSEEAQRLWLEARRCELLVSNAIAGWLKCGLLEFCGLSSEERER